MKIAEIVQFLESIAPPAYQENYDNAGLITGNQDWDCTGISICLDATEDVLLEAIGKGNNLIIAHHPIVFSALKKLTGKNYVERTLLTAIKNDLAIYAIHTNLDNLITGVNGKLADMLGLQHRRVLLPKAATLKKLVCFVPAEHVTVVTEAVFAAGAGHIGRYSECGFQVAGEGSFKAGEGTDPFVGEIGKRHYEQEMRLEFSFAAVLEKQIVDALIQSHPYEEVAYDLYSMSNSVGGIGSGLIGELREEVPVQDFLQQLKSLLKVPVIRHTPLIKSSIKRVAICGGAGSFLISNALQNRADIYITADIKYHEFFDADGRMIIADPGHFETEQFTIDLLYELLAEKFPTFAVFKTEVKTNPVNYYI